MKADQGLLLDGLFQYQEGKIQLFFSIFQGINCGRAKFLLVTASTVTAAIERTAAHAPTSA